MKKGKLSAGRYLAALVSVLMIFTLAACGGSGDSGSEGGSASGDVVVMKAAHSVSTTHPYHLGLVKYKELVEERTNGKVQIDIYDSAVLGDERACIEGLQVGTIDIAVSSTGPLGNFVSDFLVLDLPYLFPDTETARKILDGESGQQLLDQLPSIGITGAAFWENGFRQLTNSKRPINSLADLKGLKIRTMENEIHMAAFKEMGVDPTPMAWSDVFASLQQGVIDGQENPLAIIESQKINEVNKYLAITNHVYSPSVLLISNKTLEQFDEDTQKILIDSAKEAGDYERQLLSDGEATTLENLKKAGMEVTEPNLDEFRDAAQKVYGNYSDKFTDGLLDSILEQVK